MLLVNGRNDEALEILERIQSFQETEEAAGQLSDRNELAMVYMYKAIALGNQKRHEEALEMFDRARHIKEDLDADGLLSNRNELATIYELMGVLFLEQSRLPEALSAYIKLVNLLNEQKTVGKPFDNETLECAKKTISEIKQQMVILANNSLGDGNSYDIEIPDWAFENVLDSLYQDDIEDSE